VAGITPNFGTAPSVQLTATQGNALIPRVSYNGRNVYPITGHSALAELAGSSTGPLHSEPVGEEQYGRTYLHYGKWKATFIEPPWGPLDGHWQLYDIEADRGEANDVSAQHPEIVNQLYQYWRDYLYNTGGIDPLRPLGVY
jgi:arylsulfatase